MRPIKQFLNSPPPYYYLILLFVGIFFTRLFIGIYLFNHNGISLNGDDWRYISQAKDILANGIPVEWHQDGPGFPYVIALIFLIFGEKYIYVVVLNALLSTLVSYLIYLIGKTIFSEKAALLALLWSAFYVSFFRYTGNVLKEYLILVLFLYSIFCFVLTLQQQNLHRNTFLFTLLYALLVHVDERFLAFFPFIILSYIFIKNIPLSKRIQLIALSGFFFIMLLTPWTIRNYHFYGRPVLITERTAKFTDPIFHYTKSTYDVEGISPYNREYLPLYEAITDSLVRGMDVKSKVAFIDGIRKAVQNNEIPVTYSFSKNIWEEFKEYWRFSSFKSTFHANGYRYAAGGWSNAHNFTGIINFGLLIPFFILGVFFSLKEKNNYSLLLIAIIIFHMLFHIFVYHVRERYRIHVDPLIILIAFYGLIRVFTLISNKNIIISKEISIT